MPLPADVCIRRFGAVSGGTTLRIESYDEVSLQGTLDIGVARLLEVPFEGSLPKHLVLPPLEPGRLHDLVLTVTDGTTPPVTVRSPFVYSGERLLIINTPPIASLAGARVFECSGPGGGLVSLDASGSADVDSSPGTHDDLASFEWFEDFGAPGERRLGSGEHLGVTLPVGAHHVTLLVTDSAGETDAAGALVTVQDLLPPALTISANPPLLWPPDHRMVSIAVSWNVRDLCEPSVGVALLSATSSEADDAPGAGDGTTIHDIQGAEIGTPDASLNLRAERAAGGPGRTYELTYVAIDSTGNASTGVVTVSVPGRQGARSAP
jgi:hypothetical protein